jgi:hypothetical protein
MTKRLAHCILILCIMFLAFAPEQAKAQAPESDTTSQSTNNDRLISKEAQAFVEKNAIFQNEEILNPSKAKIKKPHNPKKATIMSACLPGLGQIYNGKWWKVPIVYGGLGGFGYLIYTNKNEYDRFLLAYRVSTNSLNEGEVATEDALQLAQSYPASSLQTYKDSYRRDFELYCILIVAWYGLNIVDATVDGHLYSYEISDDLSFSIDPSFVSAEMPSIMNYTGKRTASISFKLNF